MIILQYFLADLSSQAKRKSITGVKKKKKTTGPGPSICLPPSSDLESAPKRKQLLSTRNEYTVSKNSRARQIMKPCMRTLFPLRNSAKSPSTRTFESPNEARFSKDYRDQMDCAGPACPRRSPPPLPSCRITSACELCLGAEQDRSPGDTGIYKAGVSSCQMLPRAFNTKIYVSLLSRLPKMPFPPKTNASDFDHAKLVNSNVNPPGICQVQYVADMTPARIPTKTAKHTSEYCLT